MIHLGQLGRCLTLHRSARGKLVRMRHKSCGVCSATIVAIGILASCLACSSSPSPPTNHVTRELRELYEADQNEPYPVGEPTDSAARVAFFTAHWNQHFKPRHDRVRALIESDRLVSGEDYFVAGMILNHGIAAEDNMTDALRRQFCVPGLAKQQELAALLQSERRDEFDRRTVACPRGVQ